MTTRSKNTVAASVPSIPLKTILDDIMKANPNATLDAKKMRARLRATPATRDIHLHNASWIFTQKQYDTVRAMFDPAYAKKIAKPARAKKAPAKVDATPVSSDA